MGAARHGLELHPVQVDVMREAPLHHVPCHSHTAMEHHEVTSTADFPKFLLSLVGQQEVRV